MSETERPVGRALPRDLPPNAPTPPRVQKWNRRIVGWGLAPLLITGLLGGLVRSQGQAAAVLGSALVILITVPVTARAWHLRRKNQSLYRAAAVAAREGGLVVRVVETAAGDFEYLLASAPVVERLPWPHESADSALPPSTGSPAPPCASPPGNVVSSRHRPAEEGHSNGEGS